MFSAPYLSSKVPCTRDTVEKLSDCMEELNGSGTTPDSISGLAVSEKGTAPARRAISVSPSCLGMALTTRSLVASLFTSFCPVLVSAIEIHLKCRFGLCFLALPSHLESGICLQVLLVFSLHACLYSSCCLATRHSKIR